MEKQRKINGSALSLYCRFIIIFWTIVHANRAGKTIGWKKKKTNTKNNRLNKIGIYQMFAVAIFAIRAEKNDQVINLNHMKRSII